MKIKINEINQGELRRLHPHLFTWMGDLYCLRENLGEGKYTALNLVTLKERAIDGTSFVTEVEFDYDGV